MDAVSEKILVADDSPANLDVLSETLEPNGYEILTASTGERALALAAKAKPDLILLDVVLPGNDGFQICRELKQRPETRDIPVIFISARTEISSVLQGFKAGGVDYIMKPFQSEEVLMRVGTHLKIARLNNSLLQKNRELENEIQRREYADARLSAISDREEKHWGLDGFVGESKTLRKILNEIQKLQQFDRTGVLITGESGTGKELVARAIHHSSSRSKQPFVAVNCVAIPENLAESMFFGHLRGSFTGATADRKGFFEQAHTGTLFLDEIGDMHPSIQAKLLRVLEDGKVSPVGAIQPKEVDVRVIAATNADLDAQIASGAFRRDLYFRLARYNVESPPLRERREDIELLATHFLNVFATEMGLRPPQLLADALEALESYDYPGNVRELKNLIERALIACDGNNIGAEHLRLPNYVRPVETKVMNPAPALPLNLQQAEEALIKRALEETGGNVTEAARLLGVHRSRVYRRI